VDLAERAYGGQCRLWLPGRGVNWPVIRSTVFDEFVVAHTLGWWCKVRASRRRGAACGARAARASGAGGGRGRALLGRATPARGACRTLAGAPLWATRAGRAGERAGGLRRRP
jgi:hypothetical protein